MSEGEIKETPPSESRKARFESPYAALAEEFYRERVIAARKMPAEEKILAGQRLFEYACEITLAGIRNQFPEQSEEQNMEMYGLVWRGEERGKPSVPPI